MTYEQSPIEAQARREDEAVAFCRGCGHPCDQELPMPGEYWRCSQCGERRLLLPRDDERRVSFLLNRLTRRNAKIAAMAHAGLLVFGAKAREPLLTALESRPEGASRILPVLEQIGDADPATRVMNRLRKVSTQHVWRKWFIRAIVAAITLYLIAQGHWCIAVFAPAFWVLPGQNSYTVRLIRALALIRNPLACGLIAQYVGAGGAVAGAAKEALRELLPRLNDSHAGRLTSKDLHAIHKIVLLGDDDLACAAVRALVYVGNHATETFLQTAAARLPRGHVVRHEVETCLPALRKRLELRKESPTLLRAVDPAHAEAERLLRTPSEEGAPSEQLLRSGETPPGDET